MDTIFMNSGNSKTSDPHTLLLNFSDKINLKRSDEYVALSNLSINKFKISTLTSDLQDYLSYIIKKDETVTDNPPIRIYLNEIENRITFRIKTVYYHELLML